MEQLKYEHAGLASHIGMLKQAYQDLPIESGKRRQLISERVSAQLKCMAIQNKIMELMKQSILLQCPADQKDQFRAVS